MKIQPRDYQVESVAETSKCIGEGVKRPLMILPTASGKSIIIAMIVDKIITKDPFMRVLVLCHQGHLLDQNEKAINRLNSEIMTGIYCAGQGRKDRLADVILASRDSLANNPLACGDFDVIICDEAHMISTTALGEKDDSQYGKIFKAHEATEKVVVGLTGTPWRMNRGVIWGDNKFFERPSYNVPMSKLIQDGYLCPYIFPPEDTTIIDSSNLEVSRTGDYKTKDLEQISMPEEVVNECLDIWGKYASDRKVSIFFACSRAHGQLVTNFLGERIGSENVAYIDGNLSKAERDQMLVDIKKGSYKAVVNIGVLTTGFDAPIIDCVCWLRATESVSLFVQMGGRGLRIHPGKENCLMLDMAGNFKRFNSLEEPFGEDKEASKKGPGQGAEQGGGKGPTKPCPRCTMEVSVAAKQCPMCGFLFINHGSQAHRKKGIEYHEIDRHFMEETTTKGGKPCIKVYYFGGGRRFGPQYLLHKEKKWPGPQHAKAYRMLQKNDPLKIQIYHNKKTGWPEISVIDWTPKQENALCDHAWDTVSGNLDNPMASMLVFCHKCGETN
jgi:DNA repair protein RadD